MSTIRTVGTSLTCLALLGSVAMRPAAAQKVNQPTGLQITSVTDATTLANEILGSGVTAVGTPTLIGQSDTGGAQQGLFSTAGPDILGIQNGIVLTSGYASNVIGPNASGSTSKSWGSAGDADLNALASAVNGTPLTTNDANVLSFSFKVDPSVSNLGFHYAFGSEEYDEYVGSSFNDVFGFYVDGKNVALVPGTGNPVTINSINAGKNGGFFRDNTNGSINTELDGITTPLFADVQSALDPNAPGGVHTIKLAIADTNDAIYDSAVFIQGSSFTTGGTPTVPEPSSFALLGIGLAGLMLVARKRLSAARAS